ncbi:MAG: protein kinase [Acidobacteria bacterium]|nr:protein kinase [Acidobacteriota bacterium]
MTLEAGTKLGRYEIRSMIGEGGRGEVYLVQDTKLDRKVALKILPPALASNQDRMRRFVQEAKAASALNHPNIITIHEIDQADSGYFIASEFIDGQTLREHMRNAPVKLSEVLDVAAQIACALVAAHAAGIVHRDIKPENIMLRHDGIVKVLDFGLAKLTERLSPGAVDTEAQTRAAVNTDPGVVMGTASYLSPEQARGMAVDARTDIFSLGVVLYETVAGGLPFAGSTSSEVMAAILSEKEPQPLARYSREVPAELERIVSKALTKNREGRYQSAKDLLIDLRNLKRKLEVDAEIDRTVPTEFRTAVSTGGGPGTAATASGNVSATAQASTTPVASSAEYIATGIKQHKLSVTLIVGLLLLGAVGLGIYLRARNTEAAIESMAVLPFVNESGNIEIEYLSDGITESLINSLSQLPNLAVKSRSSVFRYKGKGVEPQQIGTALSVQAILNGRFTQRGDDLTLYLSLVDARTGNQIWGEQYNRKLKDLVSLQSEIARDVSQKLRARLSGADEQKLAKNYTESVEAYQLYLKGRYHTLKLIPAEVQTGISYLQQAIEIDPSYALAYVELAHAYSAFGLSGDMPPTEVFPKAKTAAQKAVKIDDTLAEAHAMLGFTIYWYDWDWKEAENQYKRALELNPNSAETHFAYAHLLSTTARHAEALAEVKRARELDPLSLLSNAGEGLYLLHAGQTDEALARLQKTIELEPNFWLAHLFASSAYIEKGMFSEAVAEARKAGEVNPTNSQPIAFSNYALAKSGKQAEARAAVGELLKSSTERYVPPYNIAMIYNGLGDRDEALAWLKRAYEQRDVRLVFLKVEPKWNNLRNDPRFQDLLRRVGFMP